MGQHAKLMSPSSADRWMTCTGAPAMEHGCEDKPSGYADEGTAAHFLGSECLILDTHPSTFIGKTIVVGHSNVAEFDGAMWADAEDSPADFRIRGRYEVDIDMAGAVNTYVQGVKRLAPGAKLDVECRLSLTPLTGEEDAFGTADCAALVPFEDGDSFGFELQIHDLKYGQGVGVPAMGNRQLLIYALAYMEDRETDPERVRLVIHQPRKFNEADEWIVSAADILAFRKELVNQAAAVQIAFTHRANWIGKDNTYLHPSDDACRFCKAKAKCPALTAKVVESVGQDLEHFADETKTTVESLPTTCSDVDLAVKMAACDNIESWIAAVRAEVERRLIESGNNEELRRSLGYKIVQGRKGARAWGDEAKAEEMLKSMRLKQEEMYTFKVISPTAAEKIFGEKGSDPSVKRWNKLQTLIVQKEGGLHVAPLDDPRAPVVLDKSAGFEDETGGDLV